jgi:DNA-directed RNA polymerase subunit beta
MNKDSYEIKDFTKIKFNIPTPDLLDLQIASWKDFIQEDSLPEKREIKGLEAVLRNTFPIEDNHKNYILEYKSYYLGLPKHTVKECLERRISHNIPLKVKFVLHITDENDKSKYVQDIEQDVFFGNIPYMTESGTFIINGAERVIVSQLQRSPGVFFDQNLHPNGTKIYLARIIPFRGSWVDFTTDIYDCIYAIIDRRRKFPATILLRAIGFSSNEDILRSFGLCKEWKINNKNIIDRKILSDIIDDDTGEIIVEKDSIIDKDIISLRIFLSIIFLLLIFHSLQRPKERNISSFDEKPIALKRIVAGNFLRLSIIA